MLRCHGARQRERDRETCPRVQEEADAGLPAGGESLEGHLPSPRGLWDFRATHASIPAQKAPKLRHLVTFLELQEVSAWEEGVRLRVAVALN